MPSKARFATLTSWSYSVYTQYIKCPFSVCLDKILRVRIQEEKNEHLVKGSEVHQLTDVYVGGAGKPPKLVKQLPPGPGQPFGTELDLQHLKPTLDRFRKAKARTEQEWAFDREWNPVNWTDWAKAWLRIKTDVCADTVKPPTVEIVDWKTGRVYEDHKQQRSLYALGGLRLVQIGHLAGGSKDVMLTASHIYTDTGQTATETFGMASLEPLKREWLRRIETMMKDTKFPTKTGSHCRYCKFRKSAGGPCPEDQ